MNGKDSKEKEKKTKVNIMNEIQTISMELYIYGSWSAYLNDVKREATCK